eukprot:53538-Prymnesium_polylepis.2
MGQRSQAHTRALMGTACSLSVRDSAGRSRSGRVCTSTSHRKSQHHIRFDYGILQGSCSLVCKRCTAIERCSVDACQLRRATP